MAARTSGIGPVDGHVPVDDECQFVVPNKQKGATDRRQQMPALNITRQRLPEIEYLKVVHGPAWVKSMLECNAILERLQSERQTAAAAQAQKEETAEARDRAGASKDNPVSL